MALIANVGPNALNAPRAISTNAMPVVVERRLMTERCLSNARTATPSAARHTGTGLRYEVESWAVRMILAPDGHGVHSHAIVRVLESDTVLATALDRYN